MRDLSLSRHLAARPYLVAVAIAVVTATVTGVVSAVADLPLRDPDGVAGPAIVRLSGILLILFALDVLPRGVQRGRADGRGFRAGLAAVMRDRWSRRRLAIVIVGLLSFYLTYVGYRNLKSFLPTIRPGLADFDLLDLDRTLLFGNEPSTMLHELLGTGVAAHVLSIVYVLFLVFVPISLAVALVWTRDLSRGFWYVTALGINWVLGIVTYYVLPTLGPVFVQPSLFSDLPVTGASNLQQTLVQERLQVLADPRGAEAIQGIAGFASLHVAIVFSAALIAQLVGLRRLVRWAMWCFFALTVLATVYLGWHYVIDDVAGLGIGLLAVWGGALATGRSLRPVGASVAVAVSVGGGAIGRFPGGRAG